MSKKKTIEELAYHYRKTGEFLPEGYEYMFDYLIDNLQDFYEEYLSEALSEYEQPPFGAHVAMRIHDWQIENGFGKEYDAANIDELIKEMAEEEQLEYDFFPDFGDDDEGHCSGLN
jgi:hypothetical protein